MYMVVEFSETTATGEPECAVINRAWYDETKGCCSWPPYKTNDRIMKSCLKSEQPSEKWRTHEISSVLYETDDFKIAERKVLESESKTDVGTEAENNSNEEMTSKKRKRSHYREEILPFYSSEDEEDCSSRKKFTEVALPNAPDFPEVTAKPIFAKKSKIDIPLLKSQPNASIKCNTPKRTSQLDKTSMKKRIEHPKLDSGHSSNMRIDMNYSQSTPTISTTGNAGHCCASAKVLEKLLREIENVKCQVASNGRMMNKLLVEKNPQSTKLDVDHLKLPADSNETLQSLEEYLLEKSNQLTLISFLGGLGGKSVGDATRRVLGALMTDSLAQNINWAGNKKIAFKDLKSKDVVISSVRSNYLFKNLPESLIETPIKDWLKQAPTRVGYKKNLLKNKSSGHKPIRSPTPEEDDEPEDGEEADRLFRLIN